jgi:hypothetical protein
MSDRNVAQHQQASTGDAVEWSASFRCWQNPLIEEEEQASGCSIGTCSQTVEAGVEAVADTARTAAAGGTYTYRVAGASAGSPGAGDVDDVPHISAEGDGPSDPTEPKPRSRTPLAAVQSSGSLNPFGNSGTAQPTFQSGSALAYVSPWIAPTVVLSYDRGTASSTDHVSSRSDEPPTPPG